MNYGYKRYVKNQKNNHNIVIEEKKFEDQVAEEEIPKALEICANILKCKFCYLIVKNKEIPRNPVLIYGKIVRRHCKITLLANNEKMAIFYKKPCKDLLEYVYKQGSEEIRSTHETIKGLEPTLQEGYSHEKIVTKQCLQTLAKILEFLANKTQNKAGTKEFLELHREAEKSRDLLLGFEKKENEIIIKRLDKALYELSKTENGEEMDIFNPPLIEFVNKGGKCCVCKDKKSEKLIRKFASCNADTKVKHRKICETCILKEENIKVCRFCKREINADSLAILKHSKCKICEERSVLLPCGDYIDCSCLKE